MNKKPYEKYPIMNRMTLAQLKTVYKNIEDMHNKHETLANEMLTEFYAQRKYELEQYLLHERFNGNAEELASFLYK